MEKIILILFLNARERKITITTDSYATKKLFILVNKGKLKNWRTKSHKDYYSKLHAERERERERIKRQQQKSKKKQVLLSWNTRFKLA